jgi:sugar lactone lactonase YvrE
MATPEPAVRAGAQLGEGPVWDPAGNRLLWVDILGSRIHSYDPDSGADVVLRTTPSHVGAVRPRRDGGLVVNLADGIGLYDEDGTFTRLTDFTVEGVRGNDAAVDSSGALWAGTMRYDEADGGGRLYRITPEGKVTTVLDAVTVSNGIGWSPDGRLMYYIDTPTRRVDVFTVGDDPADVRDRRPFIAVGGLPDGLAVDAAGCVWVAVWEGGRVIRFTPSGEVDRVIELPVARTTACAFGGPGLRDLYVTTGSGGGEPDQGALWVVPDAGEGVLSHPFAG